MKCRSYVPLVFVINIFILQSDGLSHQFYKRASNEGQDETNLQLLHSKRSSTVSLEDVASTSKRSSTSDAEQYRRTVTVPVPVPYKKINYKPIAVPQTFGYSKKPDVYIEHLHVHNGVNPCQHSGITLHTAGGFECLCKKQYKGKHCEERNYCYPNPCVNGGNCVERGHSFVCKCLNGFKGSTCADRDPCARGACKNGGTCLDLGKSLIQCSCPLGFKGKTCEEIEHCDPNPCLHGGNCDQKDGKFICTCIADWTGSICGVPNRCLINPCRNGGECIKGRSINICKCKEGFYGRFCEDNVCHPEPCFNHGKCSVTTLPDKTSSYKCECKPNYTGKKCEVRNRCAMKPCKNGVCIDDASDYHVDLSLSGYYCVCKGGFAGVNCGYKICDNCGTNAVCLYGQCVCKNGYMGDGKQCKKASDICSTEPCKNGGKCVHAPPDSFDCVCVKGFTGPLCETITPCEPNPCKNGATCITSGSTFRCMCPAGTTGPDCKEVEKKKCTPGFCLYGGKCREPEQEGKGPYCVCKSPKFLPPNCACSCEKANKNVDPLAVNPVCDVEGDCVCQDGARSYVSGKGCVTGRADPCQYFLCENGGTKVLGQGTCSCNCPPGYTGMRCETEIGRQCTPNPCKNNGTCEVTNGQIRCNCRQGFRPPYCDQEAQPLFSPCSLNPCRNGGTCQARKVGYDCQCPPRYTGPHCDVDKCIKCHNDADCVEGVCRCKQGFEGNGYNCIVQITSADSSCYNCPPMTTCNLGVCQCTPGYVMNKRDCVPAKAAAMVKHYTQVTQVKVSGPS